MKTGIGYDIHKLISGRKLILGGVEIPHLKGLLGHTDADVLIHAIIDALLGAGGLGDIGEHFPDSDPKWKDMNSLELLKIVQKTLCEKKIRINNIDCTIIAEEPKLGKYFNEMKKNISAILDIKENAINLKAKTNEGLGPVGNKEAICAFAVASLEG